MSVSAGDLPNFVARKIGLHHMALFRGHIDGLDLATLGERYLDTGNDVVKAKATLRWVHAELIAAARKSKPSIARLLRIPLERITQAPGEAAAAPITLEDFRYERDPDGFYTEADLIALFEEAYGDQNPAAAKKAAQSDRLRKKLRDAIHWLESWLAEDPKPSDPVLAWLDETVAARLMLAGINTIGDVLGAIRSRGKTWYKKVPKMGPTGAKRIETWLRNRKLLSTAVVPAGRRFAVLPSEFGIVPIERLAMPEDLSGATGRNRQYGTAMAATNDLDAINTWLNSIGSEAGPKKHTIRSYRKEAERFLLWCIVELGRPMSAAAVEDCTSYRDFLDALDNPEAEWKWQTAPARWIGKRNVPRGSEDWRPFCGRLALTSQRQAVVILTGMFEYLRRQQYLQTNPWDGVAPLLPTAPAIRKDHSLTPRQWEAVLATLDEREEKNEAYLRLRFALLLGYLTGIRLDEMAKATVAKHETKAGEVNAGLKPSEEWEGWDLQVVGKGMRARTIPMTDLAMEALADYMEARGLERDPDTWPPETPLLATLPMGRKRARSPLSKAVIYDMLKAHFAAVSASLPSGRDAKHLERASTHWLRHTHATHALANGSSVTDVQETLGHASPATTAIYTHTAHKAKKASVDRLAAGLTRPTIP